MAERSNAYGKAVCAILGIPADLVRSLKINIDARDVLTVDVTLIPKKIGNEWYETLNKLRDDGELILNVNWTRPNLDMTSLQSNTVEWGD